MASRKTKQIGSKICINDMLLKRLIFLITWDILYLGKEKTILIYEGENYFNVKVIPRLGITNKVLEPSSVS
jgi:hypothetical protein